MTSLGFTFNQFLKKEELKLYLAVFVQAYSDVSGNQRLRLRR